MSDKKEIIKEFQKIPGIGRSIAHDLYNQGFRSIDELKNQDPQHMYNRQCELQHMKVDRCLLYTFRCAVYFASTKNPDPQLLKWWQWKD